MIEQQPAYRSLSISPSRDAQIFFPTQALAPTLCGTNTWRRFTANSSKA